MRSLCARIHARLLAAGDKGQTTAEYALVLLGAALIARQGVRPHHEPVLMLRRAPRRRARRPDDGQATVELALALPVLVVLLLATVQVTVVVRDQLAVVHAAREAARAAAVSTDPSTDGAAAAHQAIALDGLDVSIATDGTTVRATVRHVVRTDVPLIGALVPDVHVTATATMRAEP
jgi:Flp pilus assembly protein TadG